jgi:hypothetical protein
MHGKGGKAGVTVGHSGSFVSILGADACKPSDGNEKAI